MEIGYLKSGAAARPLQNYMKIYLSFSFSLQHAKSQYNFMLFLHHIHRPKCTHIIFFSITVYHHFSTLAYVADTCPSLSMSGEF